MYGQESFACPHERVVGEIYQKLGNSLSKYNSAIGVQQFDSIEAGCYNVRSEQLGLTLLLDMDITLEDVASLSPILCKPPK